MATGESVPLLYTSPEKTLINKDFWPEVKNNEVKVKHAEFEDFDVLVERASEWLAKHVEYELLNCETVQQRWSQIRDLTADLVFMKADSESVCHNVKGLRLWLGGHTGESERAVKDIKYKDIMPREMHIRDGVEPETLDSMLKYINSCDFFHGQVICIETVRVECVKGEWPNMKDSKCTKWEEQHVKDRLSFLRVFFHSGAPLQEQIGVADFLPNELRPEYKFSRKSPNYEKFSKLTERAKQWIRCSPGVRVTNLQTVDTRHWERHRLNTHLLLTENVESAPRVLYLRVYYVRPRAEGATVKSPLVNVTCETFQPACLEINKWSGKFFEFESQTQTTSRVAMYIKEAGVKVFGAETVVVPECNVNKQTDTVHYGEDMSSSQGEWAYQGKQGYTQCNLIHLTRFYLEGWMGEPDPINLPSLPNVIETGGCC